MKNKSYSKMVAVFALVLAMAISLGLTLPATLSYAQGGYGVQEVGGVGAAPHPGFTWIKDHITIRGVITDDIIAKSPNELVQLTINKDTKALDKGGDPLLVIIIVEMKEPPTPPPNASVIGLVYDLWPDGVTFEPAITLTFIYDPALIPAGVAEENLVIAVWDKLAGAWVNLPGPFTIDTENNTISAGVSSFTAFTVIAYTRPAAFTTSDLVIAPDEVNIGQTVTISILVTNTGDLTDSHKVTLKINNVVVATKDVTLVSDASEKVTFTTTGDTAGTYTINVNGLSGTLVVKAPPAPAPAPAPPPTPAPPAPAPPVTPPTPPTMVNWWLTGGIIAAVIVISVAIILMIRRRRA